MPEARYFKDLRRLLDDPDVDAVSIARPNHWHSLAAIWALQAGKHVYVEKPMSHNVFEGRQLVALAERSGLVVQVGTQARSQPATRDVLQWLREGGIGEVRLAQGLCYKRRQSIGRVNGPQQPPPTCDYDLWTGPAPLKPLMRKNLHYDWHWVFDTGNGDIGNQGVHQSVVSASYNKVVAFDPDGKERRISTGEADHLQDFLDAVRSGRPGAVHAPPLEGHLSAAMCHLANISWRVGAELPLGGTERPCGELADANRAWKSMREHLAANGVPDEADLLLSREYRAPYVVPRIAG